MHFLYQLLHHSSLPLFSAFILGFITAISPCPLATNITALAFLSREIKNKKRIFYNGLLYVLGGSLSYSALGILFYLGANQFKIAGFLQKFGWRITGPALILTGLIMSGIIKTDFLFPGKLSEKIKPKEDAGDSWKALVMGFAFALAFCPYTGVLFFGMLIPITVSNASGLYLPVVFALGAGLPVALTAYIIAFAFQGIGNFYGRIKNFEGWFRKFIALVFMAAGGYYVYHAYF